MIETSDGAKRVISYGHPMHGFSNQQNEFFALLFMMYTAHKIGIKHFVAVGDSRLAISAMEKSFKLENKKLKSILRDIFMLSNTFETVSFRKISRENNRKAHIMANIGAQRIYNKDYNDLDDDIEEQ